MGLKAILADPEARADYAARIAKFTEENRSTRRPFVWVMPSEALELPSDAADTFAEVVLGQLPDGRWLYSWSAGRGRSSYSFSALGYLTPAPESYCATRHEAIGAALDELTAWASDVPRIQKWAAEQSQCQGELF